MESDHAAMRMVCRSGRARREIETGRARPCLPGTPRPGLDWWRNTFGRSPGSRL